MGVHGCHCVDRRLGEVASPGPLDRLCVAYHRYPSVTGVAPPVVYEISRLQMLASLRPRVRQMIFGRHIEQDERNRRPKDQPAEFRYLIYRNKFRRTAISPRTSTRARSSCLNETQGLR